MVSPAAKKEAPKGTESVETKKQNLLNFKELKQEIKPIPKEFKKHISGSVAALRTPLTPDLSKKMNLKLGNHWLTSEESAYNLTIGSHANADWMRRFALDKTRKTSEPEVGSKGNKGLSSYRSTDCIPKDSSSSDSDLLRSAPPWSRSKFRFNSEKERKSDTLTILEKESKSSSSTTPVSESAPESTSSSLSSSSKLPDDAEMAAKKQRIKRSLMKRARSVAIFSLKLKEKRAIQGGKVPDASKAKESKPSWGTKPEGATGGELGCIPIEMLISVDDVAKDLERRQSPSS